MRRSIPWLLFGVLAISNMSIYGLENEPSKSTKWEYASLTLREATSLVSAKNGFPANKKEVTIGFDAQDAPNDSWYYKSYGDEAGSSGEKFSNRLPGFFYHIPEFYKKFAGRDLPEKYKDSQSEIPILDAIGDRGWELVTEIRERVEEAGKSLSAERKFYFRRPKS